jgi:hypothetical protein
MCHRSIKNQKSVYRFSTLLGPPPMPQCWWHFDTDPRNEMIIVPSQPTKDFHAQMKKIFATIQSLQLKYSITQNLDIWKKLDLSKWHQLITTQNQNSLGTFQVRWTRRHSVVADTMPAGPPYLKCTKKNLEYKKYI